jgi:hypothetical protein
MMQEGAVKRALDDYKIVTNAEFFDKYKMTKREFYDQVINAGNTEKPYKAPQACPQCGKAHESCVCESTGMYETALNPNNPKDDYEAKRRALHDLSLNKGVDQAAVLQRRLDLDREAKAKGITETVVDVKAGMAEIYRRLAPKIERHRDSFLAGQLYDELENYAELHGAEREFKQMMNGARNRAHMEYDTNPGGFHNWFWFLPFEDEGINEGLLYSGDTWQDVLYRINVLNDIFGDQKDLAASFEPASQPEWGPFRDRILRSRTVLDTYAKVKQLANMNVPLTDVEIEMLADVAWDGGGGPVEPAGHWGERDYDWLEDLYAQQFAVVQHLLDQKAQGRGQNTTKSGQTVHEQGLAESNDDVKKRMSKLEALALAANRAGDDAKCKMYQQKIQSLKQKLSQSMAEGWSDKFVAQRTGQPRTPYSVYIKGKKWKDFENDDHARAVMDKLKAKFRADGRDPETITIAPTDMTEQSVMYKTTIPRKSVIQGYTVFFNPKTRLVSITRGGDSEEAAIEQARISQSTMLAFRSAVDRMINKIENDQGVTEAEKEPTTRQELLNRVDKIQRMMTLDRNPANLQILRKELEMLKQRYQHLREDSDSEAVEMAIIRRILVAHTDLIMEFGLDKVTQAIEEVAYNVGDVDEIGTSDVSAYVQQVKQILGVDA